MRWLSTRAILPLHQPPSNTAFAVRVFAGATLMATASHLADSAQAVGIGVAFIIAGRVVTSGVADYSSHAINLVAVATIQTTQVVNARLAVIVPAAVPLFVRVPQTACQVLATLFWATLFVLALFCSWVSHASAIRCTCVATTSHAAIINAILAEPAVVFVLPVEARLIWARGEIRLARRLS